MADLVVITESLGITTKSAMLKEFSELFRFNQ